MAHIASLIFEHNLRKSSSRLHSCDFTVAGMDTIQLLVHYVYGYDDIGNTELPIPDIMLNGTFEQSSLFVDLLINALLDCITPSTCFTILVAAENCSCEPLYRQASLCCHQCFEAAIKEDTTGLRLLSSVQLETILCSNLLHVKSEYGVFLGLVAWTKLQRDKKQRLRDFHALMANPDAIRLRQMKMADLEMVLDGEGRKWIDSNRDTVVLVVKILVTFHDGINCWNKNLLPREGGPIGTWCRYGDLKPRDEELDDETRLLLHKKWVKKSHSLLQDVFDAMDASVAAVEGGVGVSSADGGRMLPQRQQQQKKEELLYKSPRQSIVEHSCVAVGVEQGGEADGGGRVAMLPSQRALFVD